MHSKKKKKPRGGRTLCLTEPWRLSGGGRGEREFTRSERKKKKSQNVSSVRSVGGQRLAEFFRAGSEMSRQIRRQTLDLFYSRYSYVLWVWTLSPPRCKTEQHNLKICHEFFLNFSPAVSHSSYNTILDAERTSQLLRGVQRAQLYFFGVSAASYCIWSAGCLRSEAVNKGCVESLWRQPSRGDVTTRASAVHQQLSCSPPPPRGHNKRESEHMGGRAVNHSQQGRCTSRPKTVVSWRINAPPPVPQTVSLRLSHRKTRF